MGVTFADFKYECLTYDTNLCPIFVRMNILRVVYVYMCEMCAYNFLMDRCNARKGPSPLAARRQITTRDRLTAGAPECPIPGGLQTAGDHLAGGNTLPPAVCKPPGVTQFTTGALHKQPGVFFTASCLPSAGGNFLPLAHCKQPVVNKSGKKKMH